MAREIAHGEISIGVDLERVGAELRSAEAQFQKTMATIDRMDAEAEVGIDSKRLRREIAEIKAELRSLEATKIDPEIELNPKDKAALYKDIATAKALLKELDAEKIIIDVNLAELKDLTAAEKELYAQRKRDAKARDAAYATEGKLFQLAQRRAVEYRRTAEAEARARSKAFEDEGKLYQLADQRESSYKRLADQRSREAVEIEKLRISYAKLAESHRTLSRKALFGGALDVAKLRKVSAELDRVRGRITDLGGADDTDFDALGRSSETASHRLRNLFSSLGSVRLQMGFFSMSLRQAATAFVALGPVIFALAGQLISLVGVMGTSLAGALAVTSAGLLGFGLTALGVGMIMKPLIGDLNDARAASKAYGDAVRKYGENSTQAKSAQEKLNKTLGDVGPATREAFATLGTMTDRWAKLTTGARPAFFDTFASGIQAANKLMPMFAKESVKAFKVGGSEAQKFFDLMSSPEATGGIQTIMANFTAAFPSLSAGFRVITEMIGKISASASKFLPELMSGFKAWTDGLNASLGGGNSLDARIGRLVDHMQQFGQFAQSAATMLATFFSAGANEGATMLQTLTSIFDRWTAWMNSASGQSGLADFFSQANAIGSQFIGTLTQIGIALFEFSAAFAPLSQGIIAVVNALSTMVAVIMSLSAARAVVTGIGGALAGAFVASRFMAAATAIGAVVAAIRTLGAATAATSLVALTNPIIALGAVLGAAVAAFALLDTASSRAEGSLDGLGNALARTAAMIDALATSDGAAAGAKLDLLAAQLQVTQSTKAYNTAVDVYGKNSAEARQADISRKQAILGVHDAQQRLQSATQEQSKLQRDVTRNANADLKSVKQLVEETGAAAARGPFDKMGDGLKSLMDATQFKPGGLLDSFRDLKEMAVGGASATDLHTAALKLQAQAVKQAADAQDGAALSSLNALRTQQKQTPVTERVAAAWNRIDEALPKKGKALITAMDPADAKRAINMFDQLKSMGRGAAAGKALVNAKGIDDALRKLRQLRTESEQSKPALVEAKVKTGQAKRDLGELGKGKTASVNVKANTSNAKKSLAGLTGKQLAARLTIRADNRDAMTKLNQVQRAKLREKLVRLGASKEAAMAAINSINRTKIPDKIAKFRAEAREAEAADKRVQGFRDKNVKVRTTADLSGVNAAQAAINAIPANTTKTVTTNYRTTGTPRAGGGPVNFAGGGISPSRSERLMKTEERAQTRKNQPGKYSRPTLLVGEENKSEYVIATNPSYRSTNEKYLGMAANDLGYDLVAANRGKPPKGGKGNAAMYGRSRTSYDYIRDQIERLKGSSSALDTERGADIARNGSSNITLASVLSPLQKALSPWYTRLQTNLTGRANKSAKVASRNDRQLRRGDFDDAIRTAKRSEQTAKRALKNAPTGDGKEANAARNARQRAVDKAGRGVEAAREAKRNAKSAVQTRGDDAGALWRELQGLDNEKHDLRNTIKGIEDGAAANDGSSGGSGATPIGIQLGQLDKARYDVFQQFAGNLIPSGAPGLPGGGGASPMSSPSFYRAGSGGIPSGGFPGGATTMSAPSGGSGGPRVVQNITIAEPPPDPHSFSRQLGWEASSMVG